MQEVVELHAGSRCRELRKQWNRGAPAVLIEEIEVAHAGDIAPLAEHGESSCKMIRVPSVIRVEESNEGATCLAQGCVSGIAGPAERARKNPYFGVLRTNALNRAVARVVIRDEDFARPRGLTRSARYGLKSVRTCVAAGDDDRDIDHSDSPVVRA